MKTYLHLNILHSYYMGDKIISQFWDTDYTHIFDNNRLKMKDYLMILSNKSIYLKLSPIF